MDDPGTTNIDETDPGDEGHVRSNAKVTYTDGNASDKDDPDDFTLTDESMEMAVKVSPQRSPG